MEEPLLDSDKPPGSPKSPEEISNPTDESPERNKSPVEPKDSMDVDEVEKDVQKESTEEIADIEKPEDRAELTPPPKDDESEETCMESEPTQEIEDKSKEPEQQTTSTETETENIAEISMDDFSSEATPLDEGADPMPEGDEATHKEENIEDTQENESDNIDLAKSSNGSPVEVTVDSGDAQPDVAGSTAETDSDMPTAAVDSDNDKGIDLPEAKSSEEVGMIDPITGIISTGQARKPTEADESILSEDQEKDAKYVITHYHKSDEKQCCICDKSSIVKYLAQKNVENLHICSNDCLTKFKEKNPDKYIEKILRLRAFATQEKLMPASQTEHREEEFECENDEDKSKGPRKCGFCNLSLDKDKFISWEASDFCNEGCLLNFQRTINTDCGKCHTLIGDNVIGKYCVRFGYDITQFCSTACIIGYKKGFKFCAFCQQEIRSPRPELKSFCSTRCLETCQPQHTVKPKVTCAVCHILKPVEISVKIGERIDKVCGDPCFVAYKFVNKIHPIKCQACVTHFEPQGTEDLIVYLNTTANLVCSKECQKIFLLTNRKIIECCACSVKKYDFDMVKVYNSEKDFKFACSNACMQIHLDKMFQEVEDKAESNVKQLESCIQDFDFKLNGKKLKELILESALATKMPIHKITITKPRPTVKQRNAATMCRPNMVGKLIMCKPDSIAVKVQTDATLNKLYIPIPTPIYVPVPLHMYAQPVPFLVPLPIPIPVPIFIPTTRKSISGIGKEIQKIKSRVPADPLEAELLMMAEMAAGNKKDESSSESDAEEVPKVEPFVAEPMETNVSESFGEDMLTMALKMASNFEEPAEIDTSAATVAPPPTPPEPVVDTASRIESIMEAKRKNIRQATKSKSPKAQTTPAPVDAEKSDANMCLKYTFGVNAWKQWVTIKNTELTKTQKRPKLFKTDLLQLTADDLNFSLCLFVKEVRKPSGAEYAPDTIYYLCLGVQQYLYENGRVDNIFCDAFYEKFTDTFNDVCQKFANLYSDSQYIVTRVEEEHLWESKQLGAHSPLVLLNTLMFFNTKHFSLTTVDEHLQLSFSHIMKHWKRNPSQPGSRNVLLRFYPPANAEGRKKKVYEQQENDENPLRCPVKLYEFYLSKCPESVKSRNDVFYLQPERSCVPDSPVWYSTMALDKEPLDKMLNRVKMVKEINVALLTT